MQPPQVHGQMARHGHDRFFAHGAEGAGAFSQDGEAFFYRWILPLEAHHAPGTLHQRGTHSRVATFGHAPRDAFAATGALPGA